MSADHEPELHDWPSEGQPVVFKFPPAEYEVIAPDRFEEWEQKLIELTGLKVQGGVQREEWTTHLPTISFCSPGKTDACDCDQL